MIDTHCHLTYPALRSRLDEVLGRAAANGVERMITIGTTPADGQAAATLAREHEAIFFAAGLHPHHAAEWPDQARVVETLQQLATAPKMVALGEMGLDRHYADPPIEVQRRALAWQLGLAAQLPLPIVIHNRLATADTLAMIRDSGIPAEHFVFHCFTGSDAELDQVLASGAMVSFTGVVTFKNSRGLADSARRVPLDRIMVETDAPYLTPEPHRKVKLNEPGYVRHTAEFLAAGRGMSPEEFVAAADANARRFFGLPK